MTLLLIHLLLPLLLSLLITTATRAIAELREKYYHYHCDDCDISICSDCSSDYSMPWSVTHPGHGHSLVHRHCRSTAAGPFSRSSGSPLWQCARYGLESMEECKSQLEASTASTSSDRVLMRMTQGNVIMNVRESPSFDSQIVGSLNFGEIVEFKAETVTDNGTTIISIIITFK